VGDKLERKILYYPTIIIPQYWLKQTILYWDRVSSIAPGLLEDYFEDTRVFLEAPFRDMKTLMEAGEYKPIRPEEHRVNIKNEFQEMLESQQFKEKINPMWSDYVHFLFEENPYEITSFRGIGRPKRRFNQENAILESTKYIPNIGRVHKQKMYDDIIRMLERKKLAILDESNPEWYFMEGNTSMLYMALLAKYLANEDTDYTVISTDWKQYESLVFNESNEQKGFVAASARFNDILPVPRENVKIEEILKFKNKRRYELLAFWELLDEMQKEISKVENKRELTQIEVQYQNKIEKGILNIRDLMKQSNIDIAVASFKSLLDIEKPGFWAATIAAAAGFTAAIPILGANSIIKIGCTWIEKKNELREKLRDSPYSYLYYAEQENIL
jgi:hypothetical protein